MFPYIYSLAGSVAHQDDTIMRPLVMDFPQDRKARELADEYMFGRSFLVAPVTKYKERSRSVYLPVSPGWYDFWTGQAVRPGATIAAAAPYDSLPVFVRAGSIVPFGPELQYIAEKPSDPITLYIYEGANGSFTLYEDQGSNYDYEKGLFSEIPMQWDDGTKTLTIGGRKGSYEGMLQHRTFQVVRVSPQNAIGFSFTPTPVHTLEYDGAPVKLALAGAKAASR
jgi:alpha-D-xyloside xylohydrolase